MGEKKMVTMVSFMLAIRGEYNRRDLQQIESKLRATCMSAVVEQEPPPPKRKGK